MRQASTAVALLGGAVEPYTQQVERMARRMYAALGTCAAGASITYMNMVQSRNGNLLTEDPPIVAIKLGVAAVIGVTTKAAGMYMGRSTGHFAKRARRGAENDLKKHLRPQQNVSTTQGSSELVDPIRIDMIDRPQV